MRHLLIFFHNLFIRSQLHVARSSGMVLAYRTGEMIVAIPVHNGRVAPVFDVSRRVLLTELLRGNEARRWHVELVGSSPVERVERLHREGVGTVVCAGVCAHLWRLLEMWGIEVVPGIVGDVEDVLAAFVAGSLEQTRFLMPGRCRARGRHGRGRGRGW